MNAITLHVEYDNPAVKAHREKVAVRVVEYFEQNPTIPAQFRVLCYLADEDDNCLKEKWGGRSNRGIHWPIRGQGLLDWPQKMRGTIAPIDPLLGVTWPYVSVIYLHGSTCETDIGLTMTLAHEMQHFLQYANERLLWTANTLLMELPSLPTDDLKAWSDFPVEREARITAKQVAENLYGTPPVDQHIQNMIDAGTSDADVADWKFIRGIDPSIRYDLGKETKPFVKRHKQELLQLQQDTRFKEDKDFSAVDFNSGEWEV
jgi:hypothetical protein